MVTGTLVALKFTAVADGTRVLMCVFPASCSNLIIVSSFATYANQNQIMTLQYIYRTDKFVLVT